MSEPSKPLFLDFPTDGLFYMVRWIDKFERGGRENKSTTLTVLLMLLPGITDRNQIASLTEKEVTRILRTRSTQIPKRINLSEFLMLSIGDIVKDGNTVGSLPTFSKFFTMPRGDEECARHTIGPYVPAAARHDFEKTPLAPFEYGYLSNDFKHSRYLVWHQGSETFIIPMLEWVRVWYALTKDMALAFLNGDWRENINDLLLISSPRSDQKTELINGVWNIILRFGVSHDYAPAIAIFHFNEEAGKRANRVRESARRDNNVHGSGRPGFAGTEWVWYANGECPFTYTNKKLTITADCLQLSYGERRRFLVTNIMGVTLPDLPPFAWAHEVGEKKSKNIEEMPGPAPFAGTTKKTREEDGNQSIESKRDPHAGSDITLFRKKTLSYGNPPRSSRLIKDVRKKWEKPTPPVPGNDRDSNIVSGGESTYSEPAVAEADFSTRLLKADDHLTQMLIAFQTLQEQGRLAFYTVSPGNQPKETRRGSHRCWHFFGKYLPDTNPYSKENSWRWYNKYFKDPNPALLSAKIERVALVLSITTRTFQGLWIEVERRTKKESFASIFIYRMSGDRDDLLERSIEVIARSSATNMGKKLSQHELTEHLITEMVTSKHDRRALVKCYDHEWDTLIIKKNPNSGGNGQSDSSSEDKNKEIIKKISIKTLNTFFVKCRKSLDSTSEVSV